VICPGGGHHILAYDLEGTEVAEWLNSIGVTGVLLKYHVPQREGFPRYYQPLQDAQRAIGVEIPGDWPALNERDLEYVTDCVKTGWISSAGKYITRKLFVEVVTDGQGYSATRAEYQITRWLSILSTISTVGRSNAAVRVSKDY